MVDLMCKNIAYLKEEAAATRKAALEFLLENFDPDYSEEMLKPVIKRLSDPLEKNRELAYSIINKMLVEYSDITLILPYFYKKCVERLDAYDLEGVDFVPEMMRPHPAQRP
jgi:hypothetical protein